LLKTPAAKPAGSIPQKKKLTFF